MKEELTRRELATRACTAAAGLAATLAWDKISWAADIIPPGGLYGVKNYKGLKGLAELPYFELTKSGLLRLTVDGLEGGIDGHTHFALNGLMGGKPDLLKRHPRTKYYLPPDITSDLNVYVNQNAREIDRQFTGKIIINSLTPGGSPATDTHTIPNLLAEMDLLSIEKAVVFPIRFGFPFGDDMTEYYMEAIKKSGKAGRFIVCGGVKPTEKDAPDRVARHKRMGLKGIKMHPNMGRFFPDDRAAWPAYQACLEHGLPVLIHSGRTGFKEKKQGGFKLYTEDFADIAHFEEPIAAFLGVRFVLCHSGAMQNEQAVRIAKRHRNVWMDIHGQGVENIRKMIKVLGPERLMYGTDWAFYPEAIMLARLLVATEKDKKARRMIFSESARNFWGLS